MHSSQSLPGAAMPTPTALPVPAELTWDLTEELAASLNIHFESALPTAIRLRPRDRAPIKVTPARAVKAA